jgi:hypothetical protein
MQKRSSKNELVSKAGNGMMMGRVSQKLDGASYISGDA